MVVGGADESRVESGAAQVGDLCLLEDGSECSDALVSDVVRFETASEGQDGIWYGKRVGVWVNER